jgi:carboxylate-amine ligase
VTTSRSGILLAMSREPFLVGVEEELLLVDARTHALSHTSAQLLAGIGDTGGHVKHDLYAAQVEIASSPSIDVPAAVAELRGFRAAIAAAGGCLVGAGIHPAAEFGDVQIVEAERYMRELPNLRGIVQRTPDCALHVHVGMPDRETTIKVYNGLREHLPLLVGLGGNSPFWHGIDSGFSCSRMVMRRAYPRTEVPPAFTSWDDYEATVEAVIVAGEVPDYTFLWWDVRPHPNLGTVELRVMDAQSSLRDVEALAALVHGLARYEAEREVRKPTSREALAESAFRATRDGVGARIWWDGAIRPLREVAEQAIEAARPFGGEAVDGVHRVLDEGNGADRQRAAFERGGMTAVLKQLAEETQPSEKGQTPT